MSREKNYLNKASGHASSSIENGIRFMVETLFRGDLAVWDKELQVLCPQLQTKRQPQDKGRF